MAEPTYRDCPLCDWSFRMPVSRCMRANKNVCVFHAQMGKFDGQMPASASGEGMIIGTAQNGKAQAGGVSSCVVRLFRSPSLYAPAAH